MVASVLLLAGCLGYRPMASKDTDTPTDTTTVPDDSGESTPGEADVEGGLLYEVYVRSFQDSDGDGIGDLAGLEARLPYLEELGVTVLWLMPVFPSPSVAGYGVTDYLSVQPAYGDTAALDSLTTAAAAVGIRIILDVPLNHSSIAHPAFADAQADRDSPWRDRYVFADTRYDTERWFASDAGDYYYAYFGSQQPDFDWTTDATHDDFAEVIQTWQDRGVAGWRVDAVRQLVEEDGVISDSPGCHEVMAWFVAEAERDHESLVIAEAFYSDDVAGLLSYLGPDTAREADLVLDTTRANVAVTALAEGDPAPLRALIDTEIAAGAERRVVSFYASHDTDRLPVRVSSATKRRTLEVLNFTLPGLPMLYYGEELDMPNGDPQFLQDEPQRTPMQWDDSLNAGFTTGTTWFNLAPGWETTNVAAARADPDSVYTLILGLQTLRKRSSALRAGALTWVDTGDPAVLAWTVTDATSEVTIAANFSTVSLDLPVVDGCLLTPDPDLPATGYAIWGSAELCDLTIPGNP